MFSYSTENSKETHYNTLNISETATPEEIKKAYRSLSLKYHPDKNQNDASCVEQFQKISAAFEVLGDIEKRREYDFMRKNPFMNNDVDMNDLNEYESNARIC